MAKPADDRRAYGIVQTNKAAAEKSICKDIVTEAAKGPDFWAIIRSIYTGGDIAATGIIMIIGSKYTGVTSADLFTGRIIVIIAVAKAAFASSCLMSLSILVVIAT